MAEIIGVRFKQGGKIYYFRPNEEELTVGCFVVVETVRGTECGEMVMDRREVDENEMNREIKTIIRRATKADLDHIAENRKKARRAFEICRQKIKAHGLAMNLLEAEYAFDNSKIVFSFSAEGRVDFRELVKDLAAVFRSRIELRQIGVRDEAKMLGGMGVCGRPFCCRQFMGDFQSVSIKMAKEQGLSLNPVKISGTCGRLMCCLKHEQDTYEALMAMMPRNGTVVNTPEGEGTVVDRELVAGRVKVRIGDGDAPPKSFRITEVTWNAPNGQTPTDELADLFGIPRHGADSEADEWGMAAPDSVPDEVPERRPGLQEGGRSAKAGRPAPERGRPERPDRQGRPERPDKQGRPERPDKEGRPERPDRQGRPERPDKQGRQERPDKQGRPERPDKQGRPERPDKQGRPDRDSGARENGAPRRRDMPRRDNPRPDRDPAENPEQQGDKGSFRGNAGAPRYNKGGKGKPGGGYRSNRPAGKEPKPRNEGGQTPDAGARKEGGQLPEPKPQD